MPQNNALKYQFTSNAIHKLEMMPHSVQNIILFLLILFCYFFHPKLIFIHETKTITFQSGNFKVVGEFSVLEGEGIHLLAILILGDSPAYRTYLVSSFISL
jgi:hypothetical protein